VQYITSSMTPMTDAKLGADGRTDLFDRLSKQRAIQLRPKIRMSNQLSKQLVQYITPSMTPMTDAKLGADGRTDLFDWLSKQLAIQLLRPVAVAMTDKSADVCKAAEGFFGDIVRVCGPQMVLKNVRDIHGLALAIVLERLNSHGAFPEVHDKTRATGTGPTVKTTSKITKFDGYGSKPESGAVSSSHGTGIASVRDRGMGSRFAVSKNPDERERIVVRRFKFEELRLEQVQDLESDLMRYFREDLHRRLLSTDFKSTVDDIEMLQGHFNKCAGILTELFETLEIENYILKNSEASIFLPCLVLRSTKQKFNADFNLFVQTGHNIEKLREKLRELMKQIIHGYSAAKTLPYILEGLRSRNNRTRIECADLVGFLLDNHSAEINGQLRSLAMVASLTAERDGELRKAALNCLATGYKILGDDIWKNVGKIEEAQRSMLDEKFKWKVSY
ncbi:protein MOR1 isoform X1, partial [Tanacetum coccineum]